MTSDKTFTPDDIIAAIFSLLGTKKFTNDPAIIHCKIAELQQRQEFKDLLSDFEFVDYHNYPYSPLLGRVLSRLQEYTLLSSLNPRYELFEMEDESREAIGKTITEKKFPDKVDKIKEMARELGQALR